MSQQGPPPQHQQQAGDIDPVSRFKMLIPILKESLTTLMKVAAQVFNQNAQCDNSVKSSENVQQRFDKSLEDFYSILDQIELNLRLALEVQSQNADSSKYTPMLVQGQQQKPEPNPQQHQPDHSPDSGQPYAQYLNTVRTQINCAREVHDALVECAKKVTERGPLTMAAPAQSPAAAAAATISAGQTGAPQATGTMGPPLAPAPATTVPAPGPQQ